MLKAIGVHSTEQLFEPIPPALRFPDLKLPAAVSEMELEQLMSALGAQNTLPAQGNCFLGAGAYQHYIPATVMEIIQNSEFYTAYTPYQPEASQGMLQAMFEFQTMICRLTAMDVSNASHYDGATALAEAVLVALNATKKNKNEIILSPQLNPQYRNVLKTYLSGTEAQLCSHSDLHAPLNALIDQLDENTAAVVVQNPNFFGQFNDLSTLATATHDKNALLIVVPDPISLGLFKPPGQYGADLVAAEGQALGIPLSFGGPRLGIFASTSALTRKSVGRLVGQTLDSEGTRGYVLTLSTREQHIRRQRATSNICTNAALTALAATVYMATLGKSGLAHIAKLCYQKSHYAADLIDSIPGCSVNPFRPETPFFKEFVVQLPGPVEPLNQFLLDEYGIVGGYDLGEDYPELKHHTLLAVTEVVSKSQIDRLVGAIRRFLQKT